MALIAAAPVLAELAGPTLAPFLEEMIGPAVMKTLSPVAKKALTHVLHSKAAGKAMKKIGNKFFGKKHKHARHFLKKAAHVSNVAFGKKAHKLVKHGLDIGEGLGVIDDKQAHKIKSGYEKASEWHDKLSHFNKKKGVM